MRLLIARCGVGLTWDIVELLTAISMCIGGNRDFESVAVLVSWLEKGLPDGILPPLKIVVKSENLFSLAAAESEKTQRVSHESWTSIQTLAKQRIAARRQAPSSSDSTNTESLPSPASSSSTASAADTPDHPQEEILRDQPLTAKQRRAAQLVAALHDSIAGDHERSPSAAGAIRRFPHPLKFPQRVNNDGQVRARVCVGVFVGVMACDNVVGCVRRHCRQFVDSTTTTGTRDACDIEI